MKKRRDQRTSDYEDLAAEVGDVSGGVELGLARPDSADKIEKETHGCGECGEKMHIEHVLNASLIYGGIKS